MWDVTPSGLAKVYRRFRTVCSRAVYYLYQNTRRRIQESSTLRIGSSRK